MQRSASSRALWAAMLSSPVLLSVYFVALYLGSGLACAGVIETGSAKGLLLALGIALLVVIGVVGLRAERGRKRVGQGETMDDPTPDEEHNAGGEVTLRVLAVSSSAFSLLAVLWLGLNLLFTPFCGG